MISKENYYESPQTTEYQKKPWYMWVIWCILIWSIGLNIYYYSVVRQIEQYEYNHRTEVYERLTFTIRKYYNGTSK